VQAKSRVLAIACVTFIVAVLVLPSGAFARDHGSLRDYLGRTRGTSLGASNVGDDNVSGAIVTALPASATDSLDGLTDPAVDDVDVYRVHLEQNQRFVATLTVDPDAEVLMVAFAPGTTDIWGDTAWPIAFPAWAPEGETLNFIATTAGDYYIALIAPIPDPANGYPGWAGPYTVTMAAVTPSASTIGLRTAATTTYWGKTVTLSGAVGPVGMIGHNIVVNVMKPGATRWTYSSARTAYALNGAGAWQYKYFFKRGMKKGVYKFKAVVPDSLEFIASSSPNTVSIRLK
jgi:hypothetical protein